MQDGGNSIAWTPAEAMALRTLRALAQDPEALCHTAADLVLATYGDGWIARSLARIGAEGSRCRASVVGIFEAPHRWGVAPTLILRIESAGKGREARAAHVGLYLHGQALRACAWTLRHADRSRLIRWARIA